jgi:hypothetical protein
MSSLLVPAEAPCQPYLRVRASCRFPICTTETFGRFSFVQPAQSGRHQPIWVGIPAWIRPVVSRRDVSDRRCTQGALESLRVTQCSDRKGAGT